MLTRRQRAVMLYLQEYLDASGGIPPSYVEIAAAVGLAGRSGSHRIVHSLVKRGFIRHMPNRARAIEIIRPVQPHYAAYVFDDETKELRRM